MKSEIEIKIEQIRKEFNDKLDGLMPKSVEFPEKNRWIKSSRLLVFCTEYKINSRGSQILAKGYGFNIYGTFRIYVDSFDWGLDFDDWSYATKSEIKEGLTNEAIKMGFVEGIKYNPVFAIADKGDIGTVGDYSNYSYSYEYNRLYNGFQYIFIDGVWATIIKVKTIDEWAEEFDEYSIKSKKTYSEDFKYFVTEHKFQLPK